MAGRGRGLMGATATEPLNWLTFRVDAPAGPPIALSGKLNRLNRIHRPAAGPFILPSQPGDRGTPFVPHRNPITARDRHSGTGCLPANLRVRLGSAHLSHYAGAV
jgi:hypothetical protein